MSLTALATVAALLSLSAGYSLGIQQERSNRARRRNDEEISLLVAHETRIEQLEKSYVQVDPLIRTLRKDLLRWQDESVKSQAEISRRLTTGLAGHEKLKQDVGDIQASQLAVADDVATLIERMDGAFNRLLEHETQFLSMTADGKQYQAHFNTKHTELSNRIDELAGLIEKSAEVEVKAVEAIRASGEMIDALDGKIAEMQQFIVAAAEEARSRASAPPVVAPSAAVAPVAGPPVAVPPVAAGVAVQDMDLATLLRNQQQLQRVFISRRSAAAASSDASQPSFPAGL